MTLTWGSVDPLLLDRAFRADVEALFAALPDAWRVTQGFRDRAYQATLWAKYKAGGPRAAPPGMSPHEFGLAIDVVLDGDPTAPGIQPDYDTADPRWLALFTAAWKAPHLHSGRSFNDADHIEAVNWKNSPRVTGASSPPQPIAA